MTPRADEPPSENALHGGVPGTSPGSLAGFLRRHRWLWWVAWATAAACFVAFLRSIDLRVTAHELAQANPGWVLLAILANFMTLPLMTEQWMRLRPRGNTTSWRVMWDCVSVGMASMNTLPFGGGHAVAVGMLATRVTDVKGGVSLLALEQIAEGFSKTVLLLFVLTVAPLPPLLQKATWILIGATVLGFLALLWVAKHPESHVVTNSWRARWGQHLEVLRRPREFIMAAVLGVAIKAVSLVAIYAVQRSVGVDLPFGDTLIILVTVTFATLMAVSPGNVGVYELAGIAAYRLLGVEPGQAAALALIQHVCWILPIVGPGYGLVLWRAFAGARRH